MEKKTHFFDSNIFSHILYFFNSLGPKKVECPICGWKGSKFAPYGSKHLNSRRENALCLKCLSLERHRFLGLYFRNNLPKNRQLKVLHFSPEKGLEDFFRSYDNINYLSVDIQPGVAMKTEDITKLTFEDKTFDVICCSHVLEHITNDIDAMKELKRVLKPGGFAVLQVPIFGEKTFEDFTIKDEKGREKMFGQKDHVRKYGKDFVDRLKIAGLVVSQIDYCDVLGDAAVKKYAVLPYNGKCSKTERLIYLCK